MTYLDNLRMNGIKNIGKKIFLALIGGLLGALIINLTANSNLYWVQGLNLVLFFLYSFLPNFDFILSWVGVLFLSDPEALHTESQYNLYIFGSVFYFLYSLIAILLLSRLKKPHAIFIFVFVLIVLGGITNFSITKWQTSLQQDVILEKDLSLEKCNSIFGSFLEYSVLSDRLPDLMSIKNFCFNQLAEKLKDPVICMSSLYGDCILNSMKERKDILSYEYCEVFLGNDKYFNLYNNCLIMVGSNLNDRQLCDMFSDPSFQFYNYKKVCNDIILQKVF